MLNGMSEGGLSPELITIGLNTRFIGRHILHFLSLASTMDAARQAVGKGAPEGTVVLAERQTEGRGRLKRAWLSPPGCLTFSVILYPETSRMPFLVMVSALAVAEALESLAPVRTEIKWPNDVLIGDKKVCGILIESGTQEGRPSFAVIGIGLNVNVELAGCPEVSDTATSLSRETGSVFSGATVLRELLARLERWYDALLADKPVFDSWRSRLSTLGKQVRVKAGAGVYDGLAEDVAADGALMLRLADGRLLKMPAGDVTLKM